MLFEEAEDGEGVGEADGGIDGFGEGMDVGSGVEEEFGGFEGVVLDGIVERSIAEVGAGFEVVFLLEEVGDGIAGVCLGGEVQWGDTSLAADFGVGALRLKELCCGGLIGVDGGEPRAALEAEVAALEKLMPLHSAPGNLVPAHDDSHQHGAHTARCVRCGRDATLY